MSNEVIDTTDKTVNNNLLARISSRKFIIVCYCLLTITWMRAFDYIDVKTFQDLLIYITGIYIAGNVIQKFNSSKD